jgi:hypothetical protein
VTSAIAGGVTELLRSWCGLSTVFDALALDGDGRIAPEEMGLGLGAAFQLRGGVRVSLATSGSFPTRIAP